MYQLIKKLGQFCTSFILYTFAVVVTARLLRRIMFLFRWFIIEHYGIHSGKSATIRESNHGSGVCKEHYS